MHVIISELHKGIISSKDVHYLFSIAAKIQNIAHFQIKSMTLSCRVLKAAFGRPDQQPQWESKECWKRITVVFTFKRSYTAGHKRDLTLLKVHIFAEK